MNEYHRHEYTMVWISQLRLRHMFLGEGGTFLFLFRKIHAWYEFRFRSYDLLYIFFLFFLLPFLILHVSSSPEPLNQIFSSIAWSTIGWKFFFCSNDSKILKRLFWKSHESHSVNFSVAKCKICHQSQQ